jgi:hypothetical protein
MKLGILHIIVIMINIGDSLCDNPSYPCGVDELPHPWIQFVNYPCNRTDILGIGLFKCDPRSLKQTPPLGPKMKQFFVSK